MDFDFDSLEDAEQTQELKQVSEDDKDSLLQLLYNTTFDHEQQSYLSIEINQCETLEDLGRIKKHLLMNRIERKDRIAMGFTYSMTDINESIRYMNNCKRKKTQLIKL